MDPETLDIIINQTGCQDKELVEKTYLECDKDLVETSAKLLNVRVCAQRNKSQPSEFDEFRKIMTEKENIYFERMGKGI